VKTLLLITTLLTSSAFASNYGCDIKVEKSGVSLIQFKTEKSVGTFGGTIYMKEITKKKNVFGTKVKSVEVVLNGWLQNGGSTDESSIDAELLIISSNYKRSSVETFKVGIANIVGTGSVTIDNQSGDYHVTGQCEFTEN
jgi:hypothetical protein